MSSNSFASRIKNFFGLQKTLSDDVFDDLCDLLVEGDYGAAGAYKLTESLRDACKRDKISDSEKARLLLVDMLEKILCMGNDTAKKLVLTPDKLSIILILGVNGVGKTTTVAKLSDLYRREHKRRPIIAAGDTFRAAAIDQVKVHGERLGIRVVSHQQGGDPAAVIYDAIDAAKAGGGDLIIADTAGRMHTKTALVEELKKINRVVESRAGDCDYYKILILDATTGRNAHAQAEIFKDAVNPDGVILAKYDSSARGGTVFSLAEDLKLPVLFLCTGEKYTDIVPFNPRLYAEEFAGLV